MGDKAKPCLQAPRTVGVRLEADELAVLDRLARIHGSRSQALRVLVREVGTPYLELRAELAALRREIAALRALVEGAGGTVRGGASPEEEGRAGDDAAVRQVLGALLGMKRDSSGPA